MSVFAQAKYIRIAPRKMRLIIDAVRGLPALKAEQTLRFMSKRGATPVLKLLQSAMANAEHNQKLSKEQLVVHRIIANPGPTIKRYRARAFGRAAEIRKHTSHIFIELRPVAKPAAKQAKTTTTAKKTATRKSHPTTKK